MKPSKNRINAKKSFAFWSSPAKGVRKKNLSYSQAKIRYPKLKPFGDRDRDGVKNIFDCKPFNKKKQGFAHQYSFSFSDYPATKTVKMSPRKFLKKTWREGGKKPVYRQVGAQDKPVPFKEYKRQLQELDRKSIEHLKEKIKSKEKDVSIGFISMREGKPSGHEGRHTAIAAEELGMEEIPVTVETAEEEDIGEFELVEEELQARYAQDKKAEEAEELIEQNGNK